MNREELHSIIADGQPNICQIVGIKDNEIVYSDTWNNYKEKDNVHIASVTKSIISVLIGIAIDKGLIKSVNQKVLEFFPDYVVKRGEKTIQGVTLYHLLIDEEKNIYSAIGDSGNVIYVNTDKNIVISVTSTFKPLVFDRVQFIQKYIEPFICE